MPCQHCLSEEVPVVVGGQVQGGERDEAAPHAPNDQILHPATQATLAEEKHLLREHQDKVHDRALVEWGVLLCGKVKARLDAVVHIRVLLNKLFDPGVQPCVRQSGGALRALPLRLRKKKSTRQGRKSEEDQPFSPEKGTCTKQLAAFAQ